MENNIKKPDKYKDIFDISYAWYVKTMEIWFDIKAMQNLMNVTIKRVDKLERERFDL